MFQQAPRPGVVDAARGGHGEQGEADGLILKHGQNKLAPGPVGELAAADGFQFRQHVQRRTAARRHEQGGIHLRAFFGGEHAQGGDVDLELVPETVGSSFHFGQTARRDVGVVLAQRAPDAGFKRARGVLEFQTPEGAVLGLLL